MVAKERKCHWRSRQRYKKQPLGIVSEPGEKQKDSLRISTQRQGPWENTVFQRLYVWLNYKEKGSIELKLFVSMTT